MNEDILNTHIVSDGIVAHQMYFSTVYRLHWYRRGRQTKTEWGKRAIFQLNASVARKW